ncbi:MAG: hypothetical protein AAGA83_00415 [Cyanobacteria bacterium P01_F01_bin.116]
MAKLNVGSIDLSEAEIDLFSVVCKLQKIAARAMTAQMVRGHLTRWRGRLVNDVEYLARKHGLAWEQAYMLLADDREFNEENIEWASKLKIEDCWMTKDMAIAAASPAPKTDSYKKEKNNGSSSR